jgi:hypothetical protein
MKNILLILLILLILSSCLLFDPEDNKNDKSSGKLEPVYTPKIVWQTEVYYCGSWTYPFESGGYGYYPEEFRRSNIRYCRLLKIDLNNGKIIWRTQDLRNNYIDQAQKIGGYIYLPLDTKNIIMVYDDTNGSLAATIFLKQTPDARVDSLRHTAVYNNYIFWGNQYSYSYKEYHGLMRFDTSLIDFTYDPEDIQVIEPKLVWQSSEQNGIHTNIVVNDGIVYFLTTRHNFESGTVKKSYLVSLDAETGSILWVKDREFGSGDKENSLLLKGDKLYVIDTSPYCYNIYTGASIFEKEDDGYTTASGSLKGISWYDNKLYYTTWRSSESLRDPTIYPKPVKILCIDGNTGNFVWGDSVPNGSISTFPLVNNEKAYVVTDEGLRVYNAYTGVLIGVDKTVNNSGGDHNLLYNNMVIYPNYVVMSEYPRKSILTAIKAD